MKTVYWILGIIVLALLAYWIWSANPTTTNNTTNNTTTTDNTNDDTTGDKLTVSLGAQNGSGQTGTAVFTELGGKTQVVITTAGGTNLTTPQPAHIHVGACPNPGAVKYPLTNLVAGVSTTTIDATLDQLKASMPLALNIHKSAAESSLYTACGDLKF